ncbi:unnamed protein product, partial [Dicrocoelium dendriticum]
LMRVCSCLQERCLPSMNNIVSCLLSKLTQVAKNPSKPSFNHFMFETMCLCIQITCTVDLASVVCFETAFFPVFQEILQNDVVVHSNLAPDPYLNNPVELNQRMRLLAYILHFHVIADLNSQASVPVSLHFPFITSTRSSGQSKIIALMMRICSRSFIVGEISSFTKTCSSLSAIST